MNSAYNRNRLFIIRDNEQYEQTCGRLIYLSAAGVTLTLCKLLFSTVHDITQLYLGLSLFLSSLFLINNVQYQYQLDEIENHVPFMKAT